MGKKIKRNLMRAMMLSNTSINRSSFKAMRVSRGGVKFDKNDLSSGVLKIQAIKCFLWGIKFSNISTNGSSFFKFSVRFTECIYEIICLS